MCWVSVGEVERKAGEVVGGRFGTLIVMVRFVR